MERLNHDRIWREVRSGLAKVPVPIRLALAAEPSLERQRAFDRLVSFVVTRVIVGTSDDGEEEDMLPLFPELSEAIESHSLEERKLSNVIEKSSSFGRWLLEQRHHDGAIGALAKQAWNDAGFPKDGSPKDVAKRLNALGADGDTWQALEEAEVDWLAY